MEFDATVAEQIPQEYRDHAFVKDAPDLPTLVKNAVETKNTLGNIQRSSIRIPEKDAKPEDSQKWWLETRGKLAERGFLEMPPAKPEDYKMPEIEGFTPDAETATAFMKDVAHATGMTPKQFDATMKFYHQMNQNAAKNLLVTPEAAEGEFKEMMGNDYGQVMERVNIATKALTDEFPPFGDWSKRAFVLSVDDNGKPGKAYPLASHPMMRAMFEFFGNLGKEDRSAGQPPNGSAGAGDTLRAKISELRNSQDYKMGKPETLEQMERLYKELYGTKEVEAGG